MTSENLNVRITLFILISVSLVSMNLGQIVIAQNSTSDTQEQSASEAFGQDESDAGSDTNESNVSDNSTQTKSTSSQDNASTQNANSTDASSEQTSNDTAQLQNSTETQDSANTHQSSSNSTDSSDQGQQSRNDKSTTETYDDVQNQNSTSSKSSDEDAMDESQSNSTYSGNTTETTSQNATSYSTNSTQMQQANENARISSNANLTDSVAANQTAASLPPSDFDISIDPLTTSIEAGSSTIYTITVSSINGFNADVSLSITSRPIEGITASLSSNMTRPPTNASSTLFLNVQSDPTTPSGKYKLKVTASSVNISDSSASVKLEIMGQNVTAPIEQDMQFDPVALTPILIKNMQYKIVDNVSSNRMVLVSTIVTNNYDKIQPFIAVVEIRDTDGTTLYLQLQKGVLYPLGEVEVAISWIPEQAGMYQIRTFAIDELEDPEPLSVPVGKIVEIN